MILADFSDADLQSELNYRKVKREAEEEAKKVLVLCPKGHGSNKGGESMMQQKFGPLNEAWIRFERKLKDFKIRQEVSVQYNTTCTLIFKIHNGEWKVCHQSTGGKIETILETTAMVKINAAVGSGLLYDKALAAFDKIDELILSSIKILDEASNGS